MQTDLDLDGHTLVNPKIGGPLNLNYNKVTNDGVSPGNAGMDMKTSLDLERRPLYGATLGEYLDMNGQEVKNGSASLFDGTNGELTMLNHININSFLIKEAKLGGNLNLNGNAAYDGNAPLFNFDRSGFLITSQNLKIFGSPLILKSRIMDRSINGALTHFYFPEPNGVIGSVLNLRTWGGFSRVKALFYWNFKRETTVCYKYCK